MEIHQLRKQLDTQAYPNHEANEDIECFSPVRKLRESSAFNTAHSNIFNLLPSRTILSTDIKASNSVPKNPEKIELPNSLIKSRIEIQSKKSKRRQQEIVESLEMGRNNLNLNTAKYFDLIGLDKEKDAPAEQEE